MAAKKPYERGWVLRSVTGEGFAVDDPHEGNAFTLRLASADVWANQQDAEAAGKGRGYTLVVPIEVRLDPKKQRATAMDFVVS